MQRRPRNPFKQNLIVMGIGSCTTILRTPARVALSSFLAFSLAACNPSNTTNTGPTINQFGGDKNDPGGYEGSGGTGDGGGGQGILCSAETKNPALKSKLLVRDIFEAIHNSKLEIKELKMGSNDSIDVSDEAIQLLIDSLKTYFGPATPHLEVGDKKFWRQFISKISFITDDATLYPSQDANSPIALPKGCKIAQIAYWDDSVGDDNAGTLYVDKIHWKQLDQVNKVALLAHEYYFKQARQAGAKNSDSVRGKIGRMFSTKGADPLFKNWQPATEGLAKDILPESNEGFKVCSGTLTDDPKAIAQMFQYEGKDGNQYFVFPTLSSTTISINSLQNQEFTLDQTNDMLIAASNQLLSRSSSHGESDDKYAFFDSNSLYMNSGIMRYRISPTADVGLMPMSDVNPSTIPPKMSTYATDLAKGPSILWADGLRTHKGVLNLALINPFSSQKKKYRYVSPSELTNLIQKNFLSKLKIRIGSSLDDSTLTDLSGMIKVLHSDLRMAQEGSSTPNFVNFRSAYREFIYKYSRYNQNLWDEDNKEPVASFKYTNPEQNEEERQFQFSLVESLPESMFNASMNLIGIEDTDFAEDYEIRDTQEKNLSTGAFKLRLVLNERKVEFSLSCIDFDKVYADKLDEISPLLLSKTILDSEINYKIENYLISKSPDEESKALLDRLNQFLETLITRSPTMWHRDLEMLCDAREFSGTEECNLRRRLLTARKMTVEPCSFRFMREADFDAEEKSPNICTIVNFEEDGSKFIVWGTHNHTGTDLYAAKQIAPAGRFWKH